MYLLHNKFSLKLFKSHNFEKLMHIFVGTDVYIENINGNGTYIVVSLSIYISICYINVVMKCNIY